MIELNWQDLHSMGEMVEFVKLEEWCKECYLRGGRRALEIGSFHGKSTAILAQFFDVVFAVDLWGNVDNGIDNYQDIGQHHFISFIKNMVNLELIDRVIPIVGTSNVLRNIPSLNLDFIYIDASHYYEDVKKDIDNSLPHLVKGGWLAGDDYKRPGYGYPPYDPNHPHHGSNDPWSGVAKSFDELLETKPEFKIQEHYLGKILLKNSNPAVMSGEAIR